MNANELRIGNKVIVSGEQYEVASVNKHGVYVLISDSTDAEIQTNYWEPILLTPEILEKCGFTPRSPHGENFPLYSIRDLGYEGINLSGNDEVFKRGFAIAILPGYYKLLSAGWAHLQYVHQLQNFFFLFAGKELGIKLS